MKHSSKEGSAQKNSVMKWKRFIQENRTRSGRRPCIYEQVASFPLGSTVEPPEELLELTAMWALPYEQLLNKYLFDFWVAVPR